MIGALLLELADVPVLRGAACREHVATFDAAIGDGQGMPSPGVRQARDLARDICACCPVLDECREWVETTMQSRRPAGVVAGVFVDASGRFPG